MIYSSQHSSLSSYRGSGSTSFRGMDGDHKGPPGHSAPPSPLREGSLPARMKSLYPRENIVCLAQQHTRSRVRVVRYLPVEFMNMLMLRQIRNCNTQCWPGC